MRIALVDENSQAPKNGLICEALEKVVAPMGYAVDNCGMYTVGDKTRLTYIQNGILAAILLNSRVANYVIMGCGTDGGTTLAMNSLPGVICSHVEDPADVYTFAYVNDGSAVVLPFAKGFGWGDELNLEYIFEKLFGLGHGESYLPERREPETRNKKILDGVRTVTICPLSNYLKEIDQELVKGVVPGGRSSGLFFANCKGAGIAACVKEIL